MQNRMNALAALFSAMDQADATMKGLIIKDLQIIFSQAAIDKEYPVLEILIKKHPAELRSYVNSQGNSALNVLCQAKRANDQSSLLSIALLINQGSDLQQLNALNNTSPIMALSDNSKFSDDERCIVYHYLDDEHKPLFLELLNKQGASVKVDLESLNELLDYIQQELTSIGELPGYYYSESAHNREWLSITTLLPVLFITMAYVIATVLGYSSLVTHAKEAHDQASAKRWENGSKAFLGISIAVGAIGAIALCALYVYFDRKLRNEKSLPSTKWQHVHEALQSLITSLDSSNEDIVVEDGDQQEQQGMPVDTDRLSQLKEMLEQLRVNHTKEEIITLLRQLSAAVKWVRDSVAFKEKPINYSFFKPAVEVVVVTNEERRQLTLD